MYHNALYEPTTPFALLEHGAARFGRGLPTHLLAIFAFAFGLPLVEPLKGVCSEHDVLNPLLQHSFDRTFLPIANVG